MALDIDVKTSTRSSIVKHLDEIRQKVSTGQLNEAIFGSYEDAVWLNYARLERPKRLCRMLLRLIEDSAHRRTSSYRAMQLESGTDSYHENMHLIKLLGELCLKNCWPAYPVLIKQESSGKVGSGFFTDYKVVGNEAIKAAEENSYTIKCFETVPPTIVEVCTRILEFIHWKELGKI